jgi:Bacterial SH3 domain
VLAIKLERKSMGIMIRFNIILVALFFVTVLCSSQSYAADENTTTNRQTELRESPSAGAKRITSLLADADVVVVARQSGWVRVKASGSEGWIPAGHIKSQVTIVEASPKPTGGFLSWFTAVLSSDRSRSSTGTSAANRTRTATIGIRGLGEDGANAAKSNSEELQKLKLYSVSRTEAEEFAQNAALVQTKVDYVN